MLIARIYDYIERELMVGRRCPSVREIKEVVGASSTREVKRQIDILVDRGYIIRTRESSRNLRLGRMLTQAEMRDLWNMRQEEEKKETEETMWTPW